LVATDLDGTIVRADGSVSPRVVAALEAVEDAGLHVVLVTGRPPRWMHPVVHATGHRGVAVCANGAIVYDLRADAAVARYLLDPEVALEAVARLRAAMPDVAFAVERHESYSHEVRYRMRWSMPGVVAVERAEDMLTEPVAKLLVRDESRTGDAMLVIARDVLDDLCTVTHSNQDDCLLEISAPGVTKGSTLARVAAGLGVGPEAVIAFGDQPNDVPMLVWAGRGYAMAGSHPEVLAAVPRHTGSVEDDGVAEVLERLLDGTEV
jgi:Cof subfamily protein (haloacid dehalogenase superfamily)